MVVSVVHGRLWNSTGRPSIHSAWQTHWNSYSGRVQQNLSRPSANSAFHPSRASAETRLQQARRGLVSGKLARDGRQPGEGVQPRAVKLPSTVKADVMTEPVVGGEQSAGRYGDGFAECEAIKCQAKYRIRKLNPKKIPATRHQYLGAGR